MRDMSSREAFVSGLADLYYERVLCFARKLVPSDAADDIVQEVFLRLSKLEGLEHREISVSYLLKIAHNLVRASQRRAARQQQSGLRVEQAAFQQARPHRSGEDTGATRIVEERGHVLSTALARLSDNEQAAVRLTVCCGLSLKEASEALGVRVTTVTNWKYRGLQKLAEVSGPVAAA